MNKLFRFVAAVLFSGIFCASINAQVTGGAITGSVTDANGAVVPNAQISLVDKSRGTTFNATATGAGSYQFPNVPTGTYTLTVTGSGFGTVNQDVNVTLNQTTTVDVVLQAGGTTAVVEVTGTGEAIVQSDSSQLARSFDERKVLDLPVFGNQNALATLAPNVIPPANGTAGSGGVSGGVRARGNTFNVDGVDNNDISVTGPATTVIQDAVQEFTLLQNNFNAEFGAGAGGQFNTITKTGTNDFRGSAFIYYDRDQFNARSTQEDFNSPRGRSLRQSRYGFTAGGPLPFFNFGENDGPVFISGKNKLFIFGAFERIFNTALGAPAGRALVPTAAGLNQLAAAGASPFVINIFRNSVALPTVASQFTVAPTPQNPNPAFNADNFSLGVGGVPFGFVQLSIPSGFEQNSYQVNVDHIPNQDNQFRYRYSRANFSAEQAGSGGLVFNNFVTFDSNLFSFNYIKTFSSNFINDLRLSYLGTQDDFPLANPAFANFPNLQVASLNLTIGPNGNLPQSSGNDNYQIYDSVTLIQGSHNFKFGGDYRRNIGGSNFLPRARGDFAFSTFSQLLRDQRPTARNIIGTGSGDFVSNNHRFFAFGQDDWKVTPNLTLNLGLRYEYQGLFRDAALQATAANADVPGVIEFGVPETDKNNFAPRVGFAYSPSFGGFIGRTIFGSERGQSAIRANYARAFFPNFTNFTSISLPPTLQGELQGAGPDTNFLASGGPAPGPFVPNLTQSVLRARAGSFILPQIVPYTDSFTVSFQREIGRANGIELRFLHTRSRDLPVQIQLNSIRVVDSALVVPTLLSTPSAAQLSGLPTLDTIAVNNGLNRVSLLGPRQLGAQGFAGALTAFPAIGKSDYNAFSASFTRRFTNSLGFTAAYTLSKTKDNSTNELNTSALNPRRPQDAGEFFDGTLNIDDEFSDSVLDVPHRFVTSFNYDLDYFNDNENFLLRTLLGGFQINGIFQAQSGQPITILSQFDANRNGDGAGDRALFNPAGDPTISSDIRGAIINASGAVQLVPIFVPETGAIDTRIRAYVATNPNAGFINTGFLARQNGDLRPAERNSFRTNGFHRTDMVLLKNNRFGTDNRFNIQIGAEIFDIFNQRNRTIGGVGAFTNSFNTAGNASFNNNAIGNFGGRTVTLRGKFFF